MLPKPMRLLSLAKNAETGFILQTGLAPGFINVLAMSLYKKFVAQFENEKVEKIGMKVGALDGTRAPAAFLRFYMVANRRSDRICQTFARYPDYQITEQPALSDRETIIIGGKVTKPI